MIYLKQLFCSHYWWKEFMIITHREFEHQIHICVYCGKTRRKHKFIRQALSQPQGEGKNG